jgi:ketosteroid isomerase-like protein
MNDLEHRIQWLEDRWAINDLLVKYSVTIDDRDIAGLVELYTEDAVFDGVKGPMRGRAAIADYYEQRTGEFGATYHIPYSHAVERTSDNEATGLVLAAAELAIGDEAFMIALRYTDDYVKGDDGTWRFRKRDIEQLYAMPLSDLPTGLAADLRKRWPGTEPAPAELPEGKQTWKDHRARMRARG